MTVRNLMGGITALTVWCLVSAFSLADRLFLAAPWEVGAVLVKLVISGRIFLDLGYTVTRVVLGFSVAAILGIPLGLLFGWSTRLRDWTEIPVEFLRSLPAPVLFPIFMILFGFGDLAKIMSVIFACLFPVVIQTAYGVVHGNQTRLRLAQRMGFNQRQILVKIVYPQALPYIFVGLRNALSLAVIATVVVEMLMAGQFGLGYSIFNSYQVFHTAEMYAYIVVTGLLGWQVNKVFGVIESRQLHWTRQ